ncbi:PREDICTED: U-box domain-containing protein 34 [Nelumbo nucifera]|uniref:RING-type E3 ubiquitin transferase n=1 Tax=Nelumbo nucifera TaxID=4432 RepID=A0A1U7ZGU1_NELNU|nr:PREDICTED: U-box domain-containing protein 34 [Nelumbo nucifera]
METLVLEDDDPASALLRYLSESGSQSLVLGSSSSNFITRYISEVLKTILEITVQLFMQSELHAEVERLQQELHNTIVLYKQTCEELICTQNKVELLSSECLEDVRRVNDALEREEVLRRIVAEEKAKHLEAAKEVEMARKLLDKETRERVEVLSQLRHPHMVLLLGACPENGCLVYEYLENGSLEECLFRKKGTPPLPWFVRFKIAFDVACGLAFLHNSKPEPIIHRDLKPGNILLDGNFVSKIADVGLAKLMSNIVPDNITEYRDSVLAGTLHYMDPEYQRTGTIRPKSDIYAFGIITLQLLTACHPNGLLIKVENAINNGSFADILDNSVADWPLAESEELARVALKCSRLRCRDRPDLEAEVLPVLKKLSSIAASSVKLQKNIYSPSHYFCPILQEIMEDPYIASDGFTYEYRAIKAWLEKHSISPVTKLKFPHTRLTPNHALRSAIQEWKPRVSFSSS